MDHRLASHTRELLGNTGRTAEGFVPIGWPLRITRLDDPDTRVPTLFDKMALTDSPITRLTQMDVQDERFAALLGADRSGKTGWDASLMAREIYSREPAALADDLREILEPIWRFEAGYESLISGGMVGQSHFYDAQKEPVMLLQFPPSHLVGWDLGGSAHFAFLIMPDDLERGRFEKAWVSIQN